MPERRSSDDLLIKEEKSISEARNSMKPLSDMLTFNFDSLLSDSEGEVLIMISILTWTVSGQIENPTSLSGSFLID